MSPLSIVLPVFQGFLNQNIIEQKYIQEHMLNYYLKKQMENPAEALLCFYGCYCVGSLLVSVGVSTITGAVHGLLVTSPRVSDTQQPTVAPHSIADMLEAAGIFMVKRSVRCVSGAVSGAYQGARDSLGFIAAPWARLFQPWLGSEIKKQIVNESSPKDSLIQPDVRSDRSSSDTTERESWNPINVSPSVSTLGRWSPISAFDQDVVDSKSKPESESEDDMYVVLARHYESDNLMKSKEEPMTPGAF